MMELKDIMERVKKLELFKGLTSKEIKKLIQIGYTRRYSQNEKVFEEDTPAGGIYILLKGSVKVKDRIKGTGEVVEYELPAVSMLGETSLIKDEVRGYSAKTQTECVFLVIFRTDFLKFVTTKPSFGVKILKNLAIHFANELNKCREKIQ